MNTIKFIHTREFLSFVSALILILLFPPFNLGELAWIALVPLLQAIYNSNRLKEALGCGFITGAVFYGLSLHWFNEVHPVGWFFVVLLQTVFLMFFCAAVYWARAVLQLWWKSLWVASAWVVFEFFRSEVPVLGFGWNLLAYSQTYYPPVVQFANVFGAYGISFAIVLVNVAFFYLFLHWRWQLGHGKLEFILKRFLSLDVFKVSVFSLLLFAIVFYGLISYGKKELHKNVPVSSESINISVVQGNIPQEVKWALSARGDILKKYRLLSEQAANDYADLIIWPEAAYPGYFNREFDADRIRNDANRLHVHMLVGSPHLEADERAYNSAYLIDPSGAVAGRYDKQRLVPFGEYVPFKPFFSFLEPLAYSLGVSDFSHGNRAHVFNLPELKASFGTLICFEDTFAPLAREFVNSGAGFLTVITNDAWFGESAAPEQHLQASIFRAVENGVPLVRAANTGISAFISRTGRVFEIVEDESGKNIFVGGQKTVEVEVGAVKTFYRESGWKFPYYVLILFFLMTIAHVIRLATERKRKVQKKLKKSNKSTKIKKVRRVRKKAHKQQVTRHKN